MLVEEIVVKCDVCGTTDQVDRLQIRDAGKTYRVDLCQEHAAPVRELYEKGAQLSKRGRPKSKIHQPPVVTAEELDAKLARIRARSK